MGMARKAIMNTEITLTYLQLANILLVMVFLFLAFKLFEQKWSYRISKPHNWDEAVKKGEVSKELRKLERTYRDKVRFYTFWLQMERVKKGHVPGAFAELGVYKGETARIIHEMNPDRDLHLFDTFEGFAKEDLAVEKDSDGKYDTSNFSDTSVDDVRMYISGNEHIKFHKGHFPDSGVDVNETSYAFVHLDADLYQPTIAALNYFYPKLSPGGVIIIHDYNHTWEGIRRAVDEFSKTIPENFVEVADWNGSAMVVKNS
jgi:O-methyltransferase